MATIFITVMAMARAFSRSRPRCQASGSFQNPRAEVARSPATSTSTRQRVWSDLRGGPGVGEGSARAGCGVDGAGDLLLVEGFKIARHPDLQGTVALEERGGGGE